ncbi:MAG: histone deacetylase family protein, partial [Thermoprotei archaeon]
MVIFSHDFLLHRDPAGIHPERPERLIIAIKSVKEDKSLQGLIELQESPQADYSIPYLVHNSEYVEYIKSESSKGFHYIDFDTYVNEFTFDVATKALTASYL